MVEPVVVVGAGVPGPAVAEIRAAEAARRVQGIALRYGVRGLRPRLCKPAAQRSSDRARAAAAVGALLSGCGGAQLGGASRG